MTHDFVVNTEILNEHGYRVMTDGIDYTQYMRNPVVLYIHNPQFEEVDKGREVIGRCLRLFKKGADLIATIEFDVVDEFAKIIAGKVERNYLRMASIYADVKETSAEPLLLLPGQLYETVTKCKLVEISIVPIGGNDDALKLSKKSNELKLNKLKGSWNVKKENMSELKTIALALGKAPDTAENVLLETITKLKLSKDEAVTKLTVLETEIKEIRLAGATALVDKAVSLGLIPEALKASQLKSFENDFQGQTAVLSKLIGDKEAETGQNQTQNKIKEVILNGKNRKADTDSEESFDYLQKHDTVKLAKIRSEEPEKYAQLAKDYGQGVRHTSK